MKSYKIVPENEKPILSSSPPLGAAKGVQRQASDANPQSAGQLDNAQANPPMEPIAYPNSRLRPWHSPSIIDESQLKRQDKIEGGVQAKCKPGEEDLSGKYCYGDVKKPNIFAKQNPKGRKILAEFFASEIMRAVAKRLLPGLENHIAQIRFTVFRDSKGKLQLYLLSSAIPNFIPLTNDVFFNLDEKIPSKKPNGAEVTFNISDINDKVTAVVKSRRYNLQQLIYLIIVSLLVRDLDTNLGNIGTLDPSPFSQLLSDTQNITSENFPADNKGFRQSFSDCVTYLSAKLQAERDNVIQLKQTFRNMLADPNVSNDDRWETRKIIIQSEERANFLQDQIEEIGTLKNKFGVAHDGSKIYANFYNQLAALPIVQEERERSDLEVSRLDFDAALTELLDVIKLNNTLSENLYALLTSVPVDFNQSFIAAMKTGDFANGLSELSNIPETVFSEVTQNSFETAVELFDPIDFYEYAKEMGVETDVLDSSFRDFIRHFYPNARTAKQASTLGSEDSSKPEVIADKLAHPFIRVIQEFSNNKMSNRAQSAGPLSLCVLISSVFVDFENDSKDPANILQLKTLEERMHIKLMSIINSRYDVFVKLMENGEFPFEFGLSDKQNKTNLLRTLKKAVDRNNLYGVINTAFNNEIARVVGQGDKAFVNVALLNSETIKKEIKKEIRSGDLYHLKQLSSTGSYTHEEANTKQQTDYFNNLLSEVATEVDQEKTLAKKLKLTFHSIFNGDDEDRWENNKGVRFFIKTMADFPTHPTVGSVIWCYVTAIPTILKNTLKLVIEYLPGVVETLADHAANKCSSYIDNEIKKAQEQRNNLAIAAAYLGMSFFTTVKWLARITRFITMRVTSPIASAKQAFNFAMPKNMAKASTTRKVFGYVGGSLLAALSLSVSLASYVALAYVLAPLAPVIIASKLSVASTWLMNSTGPVVGPIVTWLGSHLAAGFAAIGIKMGAGHLLGHAAAATIAVATGVVADVTLFGGSLVRSVLSFFSKKKDLQAISQAYGHKDSAAKLQLPKQPNAVQASPILVNRAPVADAPPLMSSSAPVSSAIPLARNPSTIFHSGSSRNVSGLAEREELKSESGHADSPKNRT